MNKDQQCSHNAYLEGKKVGLGGYAIHEGKRHRKWQYFNAYRNGWRAGLKIWLEKQNTK